MEPRNSAPEKGGWTYREYDEHAPRQEREPEVFHLESLQGHPDCPAWGDPAYYDLAAASSENLPTGSRFWQGFVPEAMPRRKSAWRLLPRPRFAFSAGEEQRAISPEMVANLTHPSPVSGIIKTVEEDANAPRVVRAKERDRFRDAPRETWPG